MTFPSIRTADQPSLATLLRTARAQFGWTQRDAAEAAGVSLASYSRWERGQAKPQNTAIPALAAAFQIDEGVLRSFRAASPAPAEDNIVPLRTSLSDTVRPSTRTQADRLDRFAEAVQAGIREGYARDPLWNHTVANLARLIGAPWSGPIIGPHDGETAGGSE